MTKALNLVPIDNSQEKPMEKIYGSPRGILEKY